MFISTLHRKTLVFISACKWTVSSILFFFFKKLLLLKLFKISKNKKHRWLNTYFLLWNFGNQGDREQLFFIFPFPPSRTVNHVASPPLQRTECAIPSGHLGLMSPVIEVDSWWLVVQVRPNPNLLWGIKININRMKVFHLLSFDS